MRKLNQEGFKKHRKHSLLGWEQVWLPMPWVTKPQPTRAPCQVLEPIVEISLFFLRKDQAIPVTGHGGPHGCQTLTFARLLDNDLTDGAEVVSIKRRKPSAPRKIPCTYLCQKLRSQGHSAAGRIRSIEESRDLIGNRKNYVTTHLQLMRKSRKHGFIHPRTHTSLWHSA
jgi:hypothetical protein